MDHIIWSTLVGGEALTVAAITGAARLRPEERSQPMSSGELYPEIEPYRAEMLKVSALHTVYYEEVGNPRGVPIVFLHGGPGGALSPNHRRFFDPAHYRIVLLCQRGSGR